MIYIKLFTDYLDAIEPLGDAERGRLFTALLQYARTGEAPQLNGNERFLFPMMRAQIDRDEMAMAETSRVKSEAGKKGAQAKASRAKQNKHVPDLISKSGKEEDEEKENIPPLTPPPGARERKRFVPPTVEKVREYCAERKNGIDAEAFVSFYASKGWVVGKSPMKDWQAAVRTWEQKRKAEAPLGGARDDDRFYT